MQAAQQLEIRWLPIGYPDRLTRFGDDYPVDLSRVLGVAVIVTSAGEPLDAPTDLVKDLSAMVASFRARLYGVQG